MRLYKVYFISKVFIHRPIIKIHRRPFRGIKNYLRKIQHTIRLRHLSDFLSKRNFVLNWIYQLPR